MSGISQVTLFVTAHPWCMSPSRDEAVRAAEDGRDGPLPTLEDVIGEPFSDSPRASETDRLRADAESVAWEGARDAYRGRIPRLTDERDAAIRERDKLRAEQITQALTADRFASAVAEADTLRARVAELEQLSLQRVAATLARVDELEHRARESYSRGWNAAIMREREAEKASEQQQAAAETALESAPAASGWRMLEVGEIVQAGDEMTDNLIMNWCDVSACVGEKVTYGLLDFRRRVLAPAASGAAGTEPDAWGVRRNGMVDCVTHRRMRSMAERSVEQFGGTVVPLYAAPQAANGWLTPEEREAILYLIANRSQFAPQTPHEERRNAASRVCHALLARSSPPEVVLPKRLEAVRPKRLEDMRSVIVDQRDAEWLAALAAAGVTWKEVGK